MTKIKFCGITSYQDAKAALDCGVEALGFNFYPGSQRFIEPAAAQTIIRKLPPQIWRVGVFVNRPKVEVVHIACLAGLDTLQFHGDEDIFYLRGWQEWRVMKAVRLKDAKSIDNIEDFRRAVDVMLFDGFSETDRGGTGKELPADVMASLAKRGYLENSFLSGGLTAKNVGKKIAAFKPFGVDVASGIEERPGIKSADLMRAFVEAVQRE